MFYFYSILNESPEYKSEVFERLDYCWLELNILTDKKKLTIRTKVSNLIHVIEKVNWAGPGVFVRCFLIERAFLVESFHQGWA